MAPGAFRRPEVGRLPRAARSGFRRDIHSISTPSSRLALAPTLLLLPRAPSLSPLFCALCVLRAITTRHQALQALAHTPALRSSRALHISGVEAPFRSRPLGRRARADRGTHTHKRSHHAAAVAAKGVAGPPGGECAWCCWSAWLHAAQAACSREENDPSRSAAPISPLSRSWWSSKTARRTTGTWSTATRG